MEVEIQKIIKLAGNEHRYQYLIVFLCFLFWGFAPIFSCVLGFLENTPSVSYYDVDNNETTVESMDYDICDDWDTGLYEIVETPKYSWAIDLGIECDKMKISILGTLVSIGSLIGSATSSTVTEALGQAWTLKIYNCLFLVILLLSLFINKFWYYCITVTVVPYFCNTLLFSVMVLFNEIISVERKSIYNTLINSGLGIGAVFYILFFMAFNNWKYVFICGMVIMLFTGIMCHFFFIVSPTKLAKEKNMEGFMNSVRYIAQFNRRLDYFNKEIIKPEYQEILDKIMKGNNAKKNEAKQSVEVNKNVNALPEPIDTPKQPINEIPNDYEHKNDPIVSPNEVKLDDKEQNGNGSVNNNHNQKESDLVSPSPMTNFQNTPVNLQKPILTPSMQQSPIDHFNMTQNDKGTPVQVKPDEKIMKTNPWCLIKYPSIRYKFLLFCFLWMCTSMLYSGLVIGMKSLPGSIYTNSLILFIAESIGYFCAGPAMNNKKLGRKGALMFFTGGFCVMCFLMVICFNHETVCVVFYIITRFFVMSGFCIYYTFCLESYPTSIKALAYGINGASNNLGGVIISFVIEYVGRRWLYLIYACLGAGCTLLMLLLKETMGVAQPDNIPEMVVEREKEKMKNIPVVVV